MAFKLTLINETCTPQCAITPEHFKTCKYIVNILLLSQPSSPNTNQLPTLKSKSCE